MARYFPVAAHAVNQNDFGLRSGRQHAGVDILANEGAPLVAVDAGEVRFGDDPLGGNIANLYADDGRHYYYAHLSAFAGNAPRRVEAGEVIGYVGTTGNARGRVPHLHFEVHPCPRGQRCAVDPSPIIDSLPRADRAGRSPGFGPSPLQAIVTAGAAIALWAYLYPTDARALVRRFA